MITRGGGLRILYHGALNAAVAAIAFYVVYRGNDANLPAARTAAFATLAFAQLAVLLRLPQLPLHAAAARRSLEPVAAGRNRRVGTAADCRPDVAVPPAALQSRIVGFTWEWLAIAGTGTDAGDDRSS